MEHTIKRDTEFESIVERAIEAAAYAQETRGGGFNPVSPYAGLGAGSVFEVTHVRVGGSKEEVYYTSLTGTGREMPEDVEGVLRADGVGEIRAMRYLGSVDSRNYEGIDPAGEVVSIVREGSPGNGYALRYRQPVGE